MVGTNSEVQVVHRPQRPVSVNIDVLGKSREFNRLLPSPTSLKEIYRVGSLFSSFEKRCLQNLFV